MVCALRVLLLAQCSGAAARRPLPTRHTEPECAHAATLLLRAAAHAVVHGRAVAAAAPCRSGSKPPGAYRCTDRPALLRAPTPARAAAVVNRCAVLRRPFHSAGTLGPVLPLPAADPSLGALVLAALKDSSHPTRLVLSAALSSISFMLNLASGLLGWLLL